jgi:hypothetical protein
VWFIDARTVECKSKWQEYFSANRTDADDVEYAPYEIKQLFRNIWLERDINAIWTGADSIS